MATVIGDPRTSAIVSNESPRSAVSWSAIWAGSAIAAAVSLLLIALGSGLGFASISPWRNEGVSAPTLTAMAAIWLIVVQWLASAMGGYLTGRMRTKWVGAHTHEVAFRDTAHGLATWSVATIIAASLLAASSIGAISGGAKLVTSAAGGVAAASAPTLASLSNDSLGDYDVDALFRSTGAANNVNPQARAEAVQILIRGFKQGDVSPEDRRYLSELVAARTSISQPEAQKRVDQAIEATKSAAIKARQAADAARKYASAAAIVTALSMLIGAFIAAVAATLGGRERDLHP
jgi:hypothetical protein